MKCPSCSHKLRRVRAKSQVLDICPHCQGIWFDADELFDFARELAESDTVRPETPRLFQPRDVHAPDTAEEARLCPHCNRVMQRYNYCCDSNVFLDRCTQCHGIWTDKGELLRIARYLKQDAATIAVGRDLARQTEKLEHINELGELGRDLTSRAAIGMLFMPRLILPLSDDEERERFPVITVAIIALCVLAFWGQVSRVTDAEGFLRHYGFTAGRFFSIGLVTSMFLDAGLLHLISNMYFLWLFGDNVEDKLGRMWFPVFYLFCGIAASALHSAFNWGSLTPAIGASGAISGVMGAYMIFFPFASVRVLFILRVVNVPAWLFLGAWFALQLSFGLMHGTQGISHIAWFAHVGGFVFGAVVAYVKKASARRLAHASQSST